MRETCRSRWLLALLASLSLSAYSARAGELMHTVAPAETLSDIAELHYGDAGRSTLLAATNQLESSAITLGSKLRIPVSDLHVVAVGDTWSALAARYWGDPSLHGDLAERVSGSRTATLRSGQKLLLPALIRYKLRPGQTLASVSRIFYGSPGRAAELARFNRVKDPRRLQVGAKLRIPVADLRPAEPAQPTPAVAARPTRPEMSFGAPLRQAINAYLDGDYDTALERLEKLRTRVLAEGKPSAQSLLLRHLVFTYAAFERKAEACDSYRALVALDRDFKWDPDEVSPKILRITGSCQGT